MTGDGGRDASPPGSPSQALYRENEDSSPDGSE